MIITSPENVKYCNLANECKIRHDYSELLIFFLQPQNRLIAFFGDSFHRNKTIENGTDKWEQKIAHTLDGVFDGLPYSLIIIAKLSRKKI